MFPTFFFGRLICRRQVSTLPDLGTRIKQLNDARDFHKALALFDVHVQQQDPTALAVNQALKACIALGDFKRAINIHQRLSPQLLSNFFIQNNLIRLYSASLE
jgi:hypothetical protein